MARAEVLHCFKCPLGLKGRRPLASTVARDSCGILPGEYGGSRHIFERSPNQQSYWPIEAKCKSNMSERLDEPLFQQMNQWLMSSR